MDVSIGYTRFESWSRESANEIIEKHRNDNGVLLEILVEFQERFGQINTDAMQMLADRLNISQAEVLGVVTFYKDLHTQPAAGSTIRICRGESCQAVGASELVNAAEEIFGTKLDAAGGNPLVTLSQVFCLGNCALSPAAAIDGKLVGRLDVAKLQAIARQIEERLQ